LGLEGIETEGWRSRFQFELSGASVKVMRHKDGSFAVENGGVESNQDCILLAATTLISIISTGDEISHKRIIRIPCEVLSESYKVAISEDVLITYFAPDIQGFARPFFNYADFLKWDKIFDRGIHDVCLACSEIPVSSVVSEFW
jgi:hypothetical protein